MEYFIEKELKAIIGEGAFGKNCNLASFKLYNHNIINGKEWCYQQICCIVTTSDGSHYNITVKLKVQDFVFRECFDLDIMFHNELLFYNQILPFLLECRGPTVNDVNAFFVPRFFYGRNKCSELTPNDLIVIENVSTLGYCGIKDKAFLDVDHLKIALQTMAK